jgi:TnpA family transposase
MTKLVILSPTEYQRFDSPPRFNADDRALYFSLTNDELKLVEGLRTITNKVGFILQLGYFKANGKFFATEQFRRPDIDYVANLLGILPVNVGLSSYQKKIPLDHRKRILTLQGWKPFDTAQQRKVTDHIAWLVQRQLSPKPVFLSIIDFCWQNKIELPSCNILTTIITNAYNCFEQRLIAIVAKKLTQYHRDKLDQLVGINAKNKKRLQRPPITLIKQVNQSLQPSDIQENIEAFSVFKEYFNEFKPILHELQLSDTATEYFAIWVQKSTAFQLNQFPNKNKLYLHLLCYIKHQFYYRHDVLVDIFLKSTQASINAANAQLNQLENNNRSERNKTIKKLSATNKNSRELIEKITEIVKSPTLSVKAKLEQIEFLIDQYNTKHDTSEKSKLIQFEQSLDKISKNQTFFDALESVSIKLQRRVSVISRIIEFNPDTSADHLIRAINDFRSVDSEVNNHPPTDFLEENEKEVLYVDGKLRVSLYKILLFTHIADAIKSGNLNLLYSYRYKSIQEYLIEECVWESQRTNLLTRAGLLKFADFNAVMNQLKPHLEQKYQVINQKYLNNQNTHLSIDKYGKVKIATPKIDSDESEYIASLLSQSGFVPILQVLSEINRITQFTTAFKHSSIKHKKMIPKLETIFAGILGKGCNIGINRMANISKGISVDVLKNTVNWCFDLKNLQEANNKILTILNKLFLANNYRHDPDKLHTGGDGRKVNVAVDSLLASYSYKYFGKGKGVTIYTFLDERQLLFHVLIISSSEREAAYVIDGLMQNDVVKSDIHSTDTHGFTETIFAATHFIDTAFAPRFKNVGDQKIYAFSAKQTYEKRGYKILPSRTINLKLIEKHWDDILRFMITIKLKHTTASQLFKRLSSYAKDHPLYKAIKEFGRIIKSIYILTYFDDVELRQRVEKQLNKVELSNKFSKAIFFSNNQEFKQGTKEEQEIAAVCMVLIQNAILLWNYLYLSQIVVNNEDSKERARMIHSIKRGSMMAWGHVNLQGEYDFTKPAANDIPFDMDKILALKAV